MEFICLDIGNTRMKVGVFNTLSEEGEFYTYDSYSVETFKELQYNHPEGRFVVSSTARLQEECKNFLQHTPSYLEISHSLALPFVNKYATPQTLGADRIALIAGATSLYPKSNCLIIDAGTCITLDFMNSTEEYLGGSIHPGVEMRLKALHNFTGNLPLAENKWSENWIGKSTDECLRIGAVVGAVKEIQQFITEYHKKYKNITILLTGGDADLFFYKLKNEIFAHPNLVLKGLYKIALYNAK